MEALLREGCIFQFIQPFDYESDMILPLRSLSLIRETDMQKKKKAEPASEEAGWSRNLKGGQGGSEVTSQEDRNQTLQGQMLKCEM